jgi:hypothetical protein
MKFLKKIMLSVVTTLMLAAAAQATVITLNGTTEVGVLELSESFVDFYDYDNAKQWSSDTGLEQSDTVIMFLASYNQELALFTLVDAFNNSNSTSGSMDVDFSSATDIGSILFVDDSNDANGDNGNSWSVNWNWAAGKGDGMIFLFDDADNFDLDITFSNYTGIIGGKFLSFDQQGNSQEISFAPELNITAVPEPSTLAIFALGLIGFAASRRKQS